MKTNLSEMLNQEEKGLQMRYDAMKGIKLATLLALAGYYSDRLKEIGEMRTYEFTKLSDIALAKRFGEFFAKIQQTYKMDAIAHVGSSAHCHILDILGIKADAHKYYYQDIKKGNYEW